MRNTIQKALNPVQLIKKNSCLDKKKKEFKKTS